MNWLLMGENITIDTAYACICMARVGNNWLGIDVTSI